ncbi:helix-turn-helix domain-containing protein [Nitrosomonas sp.]|uniref:winged helix-turn-helix transcriptional regulator n=1 Tax=Nitrosomonas sp. TaxID=42353 RepID=UPI0025F49C5F|nr:helix-turn-helix domain-containing protein [Nitrosomonas sp.]MBV6447809.1 putative HTH-type transcriptional regulator YybR [Nitrosomonas sp.]
MAEDSNKTDFERSCCPVACALDLLGDKWTLLIIRDLLLGKKRYQEFLASPEQIATNILADRLKKLDVAGIVVQHAYQQKPMRYEYALTQKGQDLRPILEALVKWGMTYHPGTRVFKSYERNSAAGREQ